MIGEIVPSADTFLLAPLLRLRLLSICRTLYTDFSERR
jgi:hypothetical protein